MKYFLYNLLIINCTLVHGQSSDKVDSNFHLYLLIGQSNMAGRGLLDTKSKEINPQIFMLSKNNSWVPATDPVHFDKPKVAGVGPAIGFASEMIKDNQEIKIGLIPCAWGGSGISVWQPDSAYMTGYPYDDAIARTMVAKRKGVLKGILWHQGESDNNPKGAETYLHNLKILISNLRNRFNDPALPFVAGEIGYFKKSIPINLVLNQLPAQVKYTATVSASSLRDKGDSTHFDSVSARELGRRYAVAMKAILMSLKHSR